MTEKEFKDIDPQDIKIEFAPGCFDNFEGSQEELDELIAEITRMARSGELQERAVQVDFDNLDEEDAEMFEKLAAIENNGRKLQ